MRSPPSREIRARQIARRILDDDLLGQLPWPVQLLLLPVLVVLVPHGVIAFLILLPVAVVAEAVAVVREPKERQFMADRAPQTLGRIAPTWDALHDPEYGYAEPPASLWRMLRLIRYANFWTLCAIAIAAFLTWSFVIQPNGSPGAAHADVRVLAAALWLLALSLPGELPMPLRRPVRGLIWAAEFVLWIAFDQTGGSGNGIVLHGVPSAVVDGIRYSATADLIGLWVITLLVRSRVRRNRAAAPAAAGPSPEPQRAPTAEA